ncbi:MAG: hypothetical protein Q9227_001672 [Pyrenula ochraceoflavens]
MSERAPLTGMKSVVKGPEPTSLSQNIMKGTKRELLLAASLMGLPMILAAVLLGLIYGLQAPRNDTTTYAKDINEPRYSLGNAYYVHIASTKLAYISSLASTFALALVPIALSPLSFLTALKLQRASDSGDTHRLPSPFQFQLLITLRTGTWLELWRFINQSYLTLAGKSTKTTFASLNETTILVPAQPPPNFDFSAHSYGSKTTCKSITKECSPKYIDPGLADAQMDETFDCKAAGVNASSTFYKSDNVQYSLKGAGYTMNYTFFSEPEMQQPLNYETYDNYKTAVPHLYWMNVFLLVSIPEKYEPFGQEHINPLLGTVEAPKGEQGGIFACHTDLYDVDYTWRLNRLSQITASRPMNTTAAIPFEQAIYLGTTSVNDAFASDNLGNGLTVAASQARTPQDFASQFARTFDETLLGLVSGTLQEQAATGVERRTTSLVARVPRAPFIALIVLQFVLSAVGVGAVCWVVLWIPSDVRDTQARLGLGAVVAELFEQDEGMCSTATSVDELFAERRGMSSSRVAVARQRGGGRRLIRLEVEGKGDEEETDSARQDTARACGEATRPGNVSLTAR